MSIINTNSEFLFGFQATLTNPNGDPDQENKPRMDYDTSRLKDLNSKKSVLTETKTIKI